METTRLLFAPEISILFNIVNNTSNSIFVNISTISTFFQIADPAAAYHYGITTLPTLVYFKNSVPNLFDGEASFSSKREKSNIISARQICVSPDKNLEPLKRQNLDEIVGGCRQRMVLSGRLTAAPPADVRE